MKILYLNIYDDPTISGGGAEVSLHHLMQGLLKRGIDPVILSTTNKAGLHLFERNGIRIWRAGLRNIYWPQSKIRQSAPKRLLWHAIDSYNLAMQPLLRKVLESEKPDVVSMHNMPGWSAASWAIIANAGIPSVQVLHDSYLICPKTTMYTARGNCNRQCTNCHLLRLPHRNASNRISAVVGVSRFTLDRHLGEGYFNDTPIKRVIHNARNAQVLGVNAVLSHASARPLRIGYIGRLDQSKGLEHLCREFTDAALVDAELHIAGTGSTEYTQALQQQWASERIRFLGRVTPSEFYPNMDIIVVPSLWNDTLPGVVFEALAFGKPVIGSRRGGIPEMIHDGVNGILYEPDHAGELYTTLRRLATDTVLRTNMSKAARTSALPFLDQEAWIEKYMHLYEEIAK